MVKVSVVVPVYNVEKYIERCIVSVESQGFTDWELLLIDDGSTDASGRICREYVHKDEKIKYFFQRNQGQGIARNNGVQKANGKYILFLDADDWIADDALDRLYHMAEMEKLEVLFFDQMVAENDASGKVHERLARLPILLTEPTDCKRTPELLCRLEGSVCDKLFLRELILDIKQPGHPYEDTSTLPIILSKAKRIGQLKAPLYYYWGIRENSTVKHSDSICYLKKVIQEVYQYFSDKEGWKEREEPLRKYSEWILLIAKNSIESQLKRCEDFEETKARYESFFAECEELLIQLYSKEAAARKRQIMVWGSYNLRCMVNRTQRNLRIPIYHFSFSNIVSLMSDRKNKEIVFGHTNPFRKNMLQMDVEQTLRNLSQMEFDNIDYFCFDLLEERFLPVLYENECLTGSDAFFESAKPACYKMQMGGREEQWIKSADKFAAFLKEHFQLRQMILVENYLNDSFGVYGKEKNFEDAGELQKTNEFLKFCYTYMKTILPDCHVISHRRSDLLFTDQYYPHGCEPWHQNEYLYHEAADLIEAIFIQEEL